MRLDSQRWASPVAIAHRGSRFLWPENTMPAFQGVFDLGFRHIETDLHITSDGTLVCLHDDTVDRTTDGSGDVQSLSLTDLKQLDAGYRHADRTGLYPFRGQGVQIPTFEELLKSFPDVSVIADMKTDGVEEPLAGLIEDLGLHDRLIVGSFSDERLDRFRELSHSGVPTSTGAAEARLWVLMSRLGRTGPDGASALQLPTQIRGVRVVDDKLVKAAHESGLQVHVWTVNDPQEMTRLLDIGVDGLITDRPDLLKDLLIDRGEWST